MRIHYHALTSVAVSGLLLMTFKSWGIAISSFLTGIFIDLDHIYDYLREHGWPFRIKKFFHVCNKSQFYRIMLWAHGWEWVALIIIAAWWTDWNPWFLGAAIGLVHHMLLDTYHNSPSFRSYSLIWRWKNDFDYDTIFGDQLPRRPD